MKVLIKVVVILLCLFIFAYFGQAQKTVKVNEVRLKDKLEAGKISIEEYENLKKQNTLLKVLLKPKQVAETD
jgi:uncharacterized membrane protein